MKYICSLCGYVYDEEEGVPDEGIPAGTKFEDLPRGLCLPALRRRQGRIRGGIGQKIAFFNVKRPRKISGAALPRILHASAFPFYAVLLAYRCASKITKRRRHPCNEKDPCHTALRPAVPEPVSPPAARSRPRRATFPPRSPPPPSPPRARSPLRSPLRSPPRRFPAMSP